MVTKVYRPGDLEPGHLEAWRRIQGKHPELHRPFFSPEYLQLLAEVRSDVFVAVIEYAGEVIGLFPFQRDQHGQGFPPGLRLSDFHGLIASPDLRIDCFQLLRDCGLRTWHFGHLLANQAAFREFHRSSGESPVVDLTRGYDAYLQEHRGGGSDWVPDVLRKARKMGREVGPLRFEFDCRDPEVFQQLQTWKSMQRERTQTEDVLQSDWVQCFLQRAFACSAPGFSGRLSALYAGSRLIAAHFGVACFTSLHLWFPSYDMEFRKYSPGMILHLELFRAAAEAGLRRVDFGKGQQEYKRQMMSASESVAEGSIDARPFGRLWTETWYAGRNWVRKSPLRDVVQGPKRRLRGLIRWMAPGLS